MTFRLGEHVAASLFESFKPVLRSTKNASM
jgi:hypothetical protein